MERTSRETASCYTKIRHTVWPRNVNMTENKTYQKHFKEATNDEAVLLSRPEARTQCLTRDVCCALRTKQPRPFSTVIQTSLLPSSLNKRITKIQYLHHQFYPPDKKLCCPFHPRQRSTFYTTVAFFYHSCFDSDLSLK